MKHTLLFFVASLCATAAYSQISFAPQEVTSFTSGAHGNRMADIDGDGNLDIVTFGGLGVDWYENKFPEPGFATRRPVAEIPGTNYILSIDFTDFDGDGDLDVIGSELFQDKLFLSTNLDGHGTFAPFVVLKTIDQISFVKHIDMDGDGDKDLFYQRSGSNGMFTGYYENTNQPNNYAIHHAGPNEGGAVTLGDFDSDGLPDMFFQYDTYIGWVKNNGSGSFSNFTAIPTLNNHVYHTDIADIDNDGDLDIVANVENSIYVTKLIYKLNNGNGTFAAEVIIDQNIANVHQMRVGDIDNDGKPDLIASFQDGVNNYYYSSPRWYKNMGAQGFEFQAMIDFSLHNVYDIQTADLNNDGTRDIVISADSNKTILYSSTAPGEFSAATFPASANREPSAAVAGDVDGDGDLDVVTSSGSEGEIYLYKNTSNTYNNQIIVERGLNGAKKVALSDIDGDGDLDIVCISGKSTSGSVDRVSWQENDGQGNFDPRIEIPIGIYDSPDGLAVYDVDADGDNDIVTALDNWPEDGDKIVWFANDGSGGFAAEQIIAAGPDGVRAIKYADMDNDGDLDLVSASFIDNKVSWFENLNGAGSFGPAHVITSAAAGVQSVAIDDFDSDGDNDVAYTATTSGASMVYWQRNEDGLGTFGAPLVVASNGYFTSATAIASADLDYDGDADITVGLGDETVWYENLYGQANFEPAKVVSTSFPNIRSAEIVDGDSDGDLDILVTSFGTNSVALFKNQGLTLNTIKGMVRVDTEGNGCGANDEPLPNILVSTTDGTTTQATLTFGAEHAGKYRLYTGEGTFETAVFTNLPTYYQLTPDSHSSSFVGFGNIDTADFCIEPVGEYKDLSVILYPLSDARPGFDATYKLIYKNVGTTTLTGQTTLTYDQTKLQFVSSLTAPSSQTPGSLVYNFTNLEPLKSREALIRFHVAAPPTTNINDQLVFTSSIEPVADDYAPADNNHTLNQVVIGSYDPNDITCLEGESVLVADADKYLHYAIRFQNSGTASAINVRVAQQLDEKLDWTTLQLESVSHNVRTTITDENLVEFMFNNIYLPHEAANEPGSHGYILFKIKPKADMISDGSTVHAAADIFFDFNPPITTNTAATTYYENLGVDPVAARSVSIHPSPAKDRLSITTESDVLEAIVYNTLGTVVLDAKNKSVLDVSGLRSGVYLIAVTTVDGRFVRKFVKE